MRKILEKIEHQLQTCNLEDKIEEMVIHTTRHQMEQFDQLLMRTFTAVIKNVEGMRRTMPFSEEKKKQRAELLC